jgi:hypothetical protein
MYIWRINTRPLNEWWIVQDKVKMDIKIKEDENTRYPSFWETLVAVIRQTFIAVSACIKTLGRAQVRT